MKPIDMAIAHLNEAHSLVAHAEELAHDYFAEQNEDWLSSVFVREEIASLIHNIEYNIEHGHYRS